MPTGPSQGIYSVSTGMLHVTTAAGDPNHLLYSLPGYDGSVQEVLARIRFSNLTISLVVHFPCKEVNEGENLRWCRWSDSVNFALISAPKLPDFAGC